MPQRLSFGAEVLSDVEWALGREWLETNGLGGFASSTIVGANTRRYHGLLTVATKPPVGRMVLLSKLEETLIIGERRFELSTNRYPGVLHPRGYEYLSGFRLDPWPVFEFDAGGVAFEKHVFLVHDENTIVVQYTFSRCTECRLELRPLIAYRDYHSLTHGNGNLRRDVRITRDAVLLTPYPGLPPLYLSHHVFQTGSHGGLSTVDQTANWYHRFEYDRERERGLDYEEDLFNPCCLKFEIANGGTVSIVASIEPRSAANAEQMRESEIERRRSVAARLPGGDAFVTRLVAAADSFVVKRGSGKTVIAGYHWFSDWGRDTMIALPGLTLVTGRIEDARSILFEFVQHLNGGMLPNRFPDAGEEPEYNSVDAALWLFEAVRNFLKYSGDREWVLRELYPHLKSALEWHIAGTRYGIHADTDGLLYVGEGDGAGAQLTWMDARIDGRSVTPRNGKAVEIQALWYNALRIMQSLAGAMKDLATQRTACDLADLARRNFHPQFWNPDEGCLFDVVKASERDASIRPNQILAVSLTHSMLPPESEARIVGTVERHLLTPMGLRSLSPRDPAYWPRYEGGVLSRDSAYHQGTVWPWLMGPFITAYLKVNGNSDGARSIVEHWLQGFDSAMFGFGLGQVCEVADGDPPHRPGGCVAQAWSVAEILRAAIEAGRQVHSAEGAGAARVSEELI